MAQNLFSDFPDISREEWLQRIEKDQKGVEVSRLYTTTPEGIRIGPVYTKESNAATKQPFRKDLRWKIVQEILVLDAKEANRNALDHLNRGADALLFYLTPGIDLHSLLQDILIEHITIHYITEGDTLNLWDDLTTLIRARGLDPADVKVTINKDSLENLARTGNWFQNEENDFAEIEALYHKVPASVKVLCINANLFGHAGARLDQQLGIALAMLYEYCYRLQLRSAHGFWVNLAIGSDYFGEIAKLRALRRLWSLLISELGFTPEPLTVYAESSWRNKTILDAYNNMIRTTAEGMAAGIGGCDELAIRSYETTFREPESFGERIAKNQQHLLQNEGALTRVTDPARGSYFIEQLTEELAEKGWAFFKTIETQGGYIQALQEGWLQEQVEQAAEAEQQAFDEEKKLLIGANRHRSPDGPFQEFLQSGIYYRPSARNTIVKPLVVQRLSEKLEQDLKNTEQ